MGWVKSYNRDVYIAKVGYVEQFGVHSPASTVRESLHFSAALRLPAGTTQAKLPQPSTRHHNHLHTTLLRPDYHLHTTFLPSSYRLPTTFLPPFWQADQLALVDEILMLLELGTIAEKLVGNPSFSFEEMKRVTIGVEMVCLYIDGCLCIDRAFICRLCIS